MSEIIDDEQLILVTGTGSKGVMRAGVRCPELFVLQCFYPTLKFLLDFLCQKKN